MKRKLLWIAGIIAILGTQAAFADPGQGSGKKAPVYSSQSSPAAPCAEC